MNIFQNYKRSRVFHANWPRFSAANNESCSIFKTPFREAAESCKKYAEGTLDFLTRRPEGDLLQYFVRTDLAAREHVRALYSKIAERCGSDNPLSGIDAACYDSRCDTLPILYSIVQNSQTKDVSLLICPNFWASFDIHSRYQTLCQLTGRRQAPPISANFLEMVAWSKEIGAMDPFEGGAVSRGHGSWAGYAHEYAHYCENIGT